MNSQLPNKGASARACESRHALHTPARFSIELTLALVLSAYAVNALADESPDVVTSAARSPQVVTDALNALPEEFRMVVYLADVEGFSYQEIADIVERPIGTVMSRLHRGRAKLRTALGEYAREQGVGLGDGAEMTGGAR